MAAAAGVLSFVAISCLLFMVLRCLRDVAITMAPERQAWVSC
jgi:hypothetical protein